MISSFSNHTRLCSVFQLTIKVKGSTDARIPGMLHVKGVMLLKEFDEYLYIVLILKAQII